MPRDHVCGKTQRESEWSEDEDLEDLNRCNQDVQEPWDTTWEQVVLKVGPETKLLDTRGEINQVRPQRQHQWHCHQRCACDVEQWDDTRDVEREDREEHGGEHRKVLTRIVAKNFFGDIYSHEVQRHFCNVLCSSWYQLGALGGNQEQDDKNGCGNDSHQVNAIEFKEIVAKNGCRKEFLNRGRMVSTLVTRGGEVQGRR